MTDRPASFSFLLRSSDEAKSVIESGYRFEDSNWFDDGAAAGDQMSLTPGDPQM